jgi:hypothetical protein
VGFTERPVPIPIVATAVFDVTRFVLVVDEGTSGVVAVIFTSPLFVFGTTAGAVYTPTRESTVDAPIVPTVEFPPATPFTYQVTIVVAVEVEELDSVKAAVNSAVSLIATLAVAGEIATLFTVTVPLLPPQAENAARHATANTLKNQREILSGITGHPLKYSD